MLTRPAGIGRLGLLTIKAVTAAYFRGPLAIVQAASEAYDLSGNPRMSRPVGDLARDPTNAYARPESDAYVCTIAGP
jgi:hypothetical protein